MIDKNGDITIDTIVIQRIITNNYEHSLWQHIYLKSYEKLYTEKFDTLEKVNKFPNIYTLLC